MRFFCRFTSIILSLCLLTACTQKSSVSTEENTSFTGFTNAVFCSLASSDSLTLNYTLSSPDKLGITDLPMGLNSFTYEDLEHDGSVSENLLATLESYQKSTLTFDQQVTYDCLKETLTNNLDGEKYLQFSESLGPTTGIQAQLPVLLAEFRIEDRSDLDQYFYLLRSVPDYFQSLLDLERNKKGLSTLPCRSTLEHIAEQCNEFLDSNGYSMLTSIFRKKVSHLSFLSESEKKSVLQQHELLLTNSLLPAYQGMVQTINELIPHARENGSLSSYENGDAYYDYLVHKTTGSPLSMENIEKEIKETLTVSKDTLLSLAGKDASLFSSCQSYVTNFHSSEEILAYLEKEFIKDFPEIKCDDKKNPSSSPAERNESNPSYEIKEVDESLQDYLSPAFYLTPPVDDPSHQVIYLNPSPKYDSSSLFNTLAHEGYPGHLYQNSYLLNKKVPLLRHLLDCGGYTEGWATYAEIFAYRYTGVSPDEVSILQNNMIVSLCLYGLCDIGVHAHGWTENEVLEFLQKYGNWSKDTANAVYSAVVDEPASYLKYTVGYLEIMRLKEKMKELLGGNFTEKTFHTYLLDMGPCSFQILEDYMELWWKMQLSRPISYQ